MGLSEIRPFKETGEHSYHRRAYSHNYFAPFIYHIIIKKAPDCDSFGSVEGDARIAPGNHGCARIKESDIGIIIAKSIIHLPFQHSILRLHQFCVMPDHIHLLIQILYKSDRHLDYYIENLKTNITIKWSKIKGRLIQEQDIFQAGYCDKPLYDNRSLDSLFRYIRENPHRLAMRQQFPHFFQRVRKLKIGNSDYEAYGNLFLFRNPDKTVVKISRKFSPGQILSMKNAWLSAASQGTVLVSPFISKEEKNIRSQAETIGTKIILITHEAFPDRYKPSAHDFNLCAEGCLLIISLGLPSNTSLTYPICARMNTLAKSIVESHVVT